MRLRFLLGRAGSGKTHTCLQEIRQALQQDPDGPPLIFLTPEQATFQMERALLTAAGGHAPVRATHRAHVLSFQRLAARVMQETGGPGHPRLGPLGKRMLLRAILQREKGRLRLFGKSASQPGFIEQLSRTLKELRSYRWRPEDLLAEQERLQAREQTSPILPAKLHDLSLVYREFSALVSGRFLDPDEVLDLVAEGIPCSFVKGAHIWIDGFSGFTPQELHVLRALWKTAEQMTVALCLDEPRLPHELPAPETDLFAPTRETYALLLKMAREDGLTTVEVQRLAAQPPPRFRQAAALAHLEARLFHRPAAVYPHAMGGSSGRIVVTAAANPAVEVEAAAREILRLCREEGFRFREISVILRHLEGYQGLIQSIFSDYGIPYFIDSRRPIAHHPLVELIRSAFEVHLSGWAPEPLFRYLKTDLVPISRDGVDRLENYVLEHGLRGRAWFDQRPWRYARRYSLADDNPPETPDQQRALQEINALRDQASGALRRFSTALARGGCVREVVQALWELLEELKVDQTLMSWAEAARAEGQLELAREHAGALASVAQLLDEMVDTLGDEHLTPAALLQVLESGLEGLNLGIIPPGLDQVLVGSAERSRQPDIRAAFLLGVSEGSFPPAPREDAIFSDADRELLSDRKPLAPTARAALIREQYLTYIALTRASEYLWISYPTADEQGKALAPAPVVTRIRQLFPHALWRVEPLEPSGDEAVLDRVLTPRQLVATVAARLRAHRAGEPMDSLWWLLHQWITEDPGLRELAQPVYAALDTRNRAEPLPPELTRELYGSILTTSVSRLESYAACPFRHFAAYGLRLQERPRFRLDRLQVGTFLHAALRSFVERLQQEQRDWAVLSDEEVEQLGRECVHALIPRLQSEILLSSARYRFVAGLLERNVLWALNLLTQHARRSRFRPLAVELAFGRPGSSLPALQLQTAAGGQVVLHGQIDRVDVALDDTGRRWIRILDYKSRSRALNLGDVAAGLSLQLPVYLALMLEHGPALAGGPLHPAGLLYFPLQEPLLRQDAPPGDEALAQALRRAARMRGLLMDDPDVIRLMDQDLQVGSSDLIQATITKAGLIDRRTPLADQQQWAILRTYTLQAVARLAEEIQAGRIDIRPYRKSSYHACRDCAFRSFCRFDSRLSDNTYRYVPSMTAPQAWQHMQESIGAPEAAASGEAAGGEPEGGMNA